MDGEPVRYTIQEIGQMIRESRKRLGVTQKDLALTSGTGLRFVIDLEKGKGDLPDRQGPDRPEYTGIRIALTLPAVPGKEE